MVDAIRRPTLGLTPPPGVLSRSRKPQPRAQSRHLSGDLAVGMTPLRPSTPGPHAPPVSRLNRQLVHVSLKVDVIDQLSGLFGPFSASAVRQLTTVLKLSHMIRRTTRKASQTTMQSDPMSGVQIRRSVRSVRCEIGFGHLPPSVSSTYNIPVRYHRSVSVVRPMARLGIPFCFFKLPNHIRSGSWDS